MNEIRRLSYNPSWESPILIMGAGITGLLAKKILLCTQQNHSIFYYAGLVLILSSIIIIIRKQFFHRVIIFEKSGLILPTRFLRMFPTKITYESINLEKSVER